MAETKDVMSIKELAEYLGIGKSKIYNLIRQNKIPASKIGRQYRFSKDVINNWLKEKIITIPRAPQMGLFEVDKEQK
ncbi:MAG: helix-turn-helix domain-containing protein [Elusimicrobiota bacterium]